MERAALSERLPIGATRPPFSLPNVDGTMVGSEYFEGVRAALVVFTCNHCPYVKGSEKMFLETVQAFADDGLKVVAISSNDAEQYPEDSFDKMKEKAAALTLPFPYLYDETQGVASAFDAQCTPECFLFNAEGKLAYHGKINDNPKDPAAAKINYLDLAIRQVLQKGMAEPNFVHPLGCSIKWK